MRGLQEAETTRGSNAHPGMSVTTYSARTASLADCTSSRDLWDAVGNKNEGLYRREELSPQRRVVFVPEHAPPLFLFRTSHQQGYPPPSQNTL